MKGLDGLFPHWIDITGEKSYGLGIVGGLLDYSVSPSPFPLDSGFRIWDWTWA